MVVGLELKLTLNLNLNLSLKLNLSFVVEPISTTKHKSAELFNMVCCNKVYTMCSASSMKNTQLTTGDYMHCIR